MTEAPAPLDSISLMPPLRVTQLGGRKTQKIDLHPDAAMRQQIASVLGLEGLRKFRFQAELRPLGRTDWELAGQLGATVVQQCAITLAPVTSRIDEEVTRRFLADLPQPEGPEVEMPEDDSLEPLGQEIDVSALALEALALALPAFPRAPGAELAPSGVLTQLPEGATPLTDDDPRPKPFAGLAGLRDALAQAHPPKRDETE